jgi:hypothetical protein
MIKIRLDNFIIPPKNGHLMPVNPKFYTKCPLDIHDYVNVFHSLQMEPNLITPLRCQHRALKGIRKYVKKFLKDMCIFGMFC